MIRIWAIIERDLRRFRRSRALLLMSILMPLLQLVVLGYAFGGNVKNLNLAVVDEDHGIQAVKIREMLQSVEANARTFVVRSYDDEAVALRDLREGRVNGIVTIPPNFSRKVLAGESPRLALIEDNTDQFSSNAMQGVLTPMLGAFNQRPSGARMSSAVDLAVVEVYPYVPYIQFLLPGTTILAVYVSVMIGGGIIFIDDKARGLHEGYLVTPISKFELILGFTLSGVVKAVLSGMVLVILGSLIAGISDPFNLERMARMSVIVVAAAFALVSMMFLLVVRMNDPLLPRALFGMLNTLLFFPSGAIYPIQAFPGWMRALSRIDPFTYAVHALKVVLLKGAGLGACGYDLVFLFAFTVVAMFFATLLFRRTL